jgi:hypothetical protein
MSFLLSIVPVAGAGDYITGAAPRIGDDQPWRRPPYSERHERGAAARRRAVCSRTPRGAAARSRVWATALCCMTSEVHYR